MKLPKQTNTSKAFDLVEEGLIFHKNNQLNEARTLYEKVLKLPFKIEPLAKFDAYRLLAKIAITEKDLSKGISLLKEALNIQAQNLEAQFDLANLYQMNGEFASSIDTYQQAIQIDPNHFQSYGNLALALSSIGKIEQSENALKKSIEINPNYADGWCNLGVIYKDTHQLEKARDCFNEAVRLKPKLTEAFVNLANTLHELGKYDEAIESCDQALLIQPKLFQAYNNKGNIFRSIGKFEESLQCYQEAIRINPDFPEAYNNCGLVLQDLKRINEGIHHFEMAIQVNPQYAIAYCNLGEAHRTLKNLPLALEYCNKAITIDLFLSPAYSTRGLILYQLKKYEESLASYRKAIDLNPNYPEAYCNAGVVLKALKQLTQALEYYDKAISIKPNYAIAICNQGVVLKELDRLEDALFCYNQAISLDPKFAEAFNNRGIVLKELGLNNQALDSYQSAIKLDPDNGTFHWNLSILYLLQGNFDNGFQEYEWRWKDEEVSLISGKQNFKEPLWLGDQPLSGKKILLYPEQGLGDTIQFSRYVPLFTHLGCQVILEVQAPLLPLFEHLSGVHQIVSRGDPLPAFDYQCPLMSLPLAFGTSQETIPPIQPITLSTEKITQWQSRLGPKIKPRIGLVWSGSTTHKEDRRRSIQLSDYLKYLTNDFEYFSLQKEVRENDLDDLQNSFIRHFEDELNDFSDTAALISQLDLVISVDTSVAHLAASLNKPTLILIPYVPDWRWMLNRDDSPWYPTVKLYRQTTLGDWQTTLQTLFKELDSIKHI